MGGSNMELRNFNVEKVYKKVVKCVIGDKIGVNDNFNSEIENIRSMISQVDVVNGEFLLMRGHIRKDGEQWTPFLQPVIMLVQLAKRAHLVDYEGNLKPTSVIKVLV